MKSLQTGLGVTFKDGGLQSRFVYKVEEELAFPIIENEALGAMEGTHKALKAATKTAAMVGGLVLATTMIGCDDDGGGIDPIDPNPVVNDSSPTNEVLLQNTQLTEHTDGAKKGDIIYEIRTSDPEKISEYTNIKEEAIAAGHGEAANRLLSVVETPIEIGDSKGVHCTISLGDDLDADNPADVALMDFLSDKNFSSTDAFSDVSKRRTSSNSMGIWSLKDNFEISDDATLYDLPIGINSGGDFVTSVNGSEAKLKTMADTFNGVELEPGMISVLSNALSRIVTGTNSNFWHDHRWIHDFSGHTLTLKSDNSVVLNEEDLGKAVQTAFLDYGLESTHQEAGEIGGSLLDDLTDPSSANQVARFLEGLLDVVAKKGPEDFNTKSALVLDGIR